LLRPLGSRNDDASLAEMEDALAEAIGMLGIGPMGLGGSTTALGVRIAVEHCHTASLPVGVCMQCWAARRASARIWPDGRWEVLP